MSDEPAYIQPTVTPKSLQVDKALIRLSFLLWLGGFIIAIITKHAKWFTMQEELQ